MCNSQTIGQAIRSKIKAKDFNPTKPMVDTRHTFVPVFDEDNVMKLVEVLELGRKL